MRELTVRAWLPVCVAAGVAAGSPVPAARADPVPVFPGMEIIQDTHVCTLGYVDQIRRIAYTAGHCRGSGSVVDADGHLIGSMAAFRDNTPDGTTVNTDQEIADYEIVALAEGVAANDILPGGRRLESDPVVTVQPGEAVCHFGIVTQESCGTVESVNNGWFTMSHGVVTRKGDSGGPVYAVSGPGPARIVGLFTSIWGEYPAAVAWPAVSRQADADIGAVPERG